MDYLRYPGGCYSRRVRIHPDDARLYTIRWFFAPEGAKLFPGWHSFASEVWREDHSLPWDGIGEAEPARTFDRGKNTGYGGQCYVGNLEWFDKGMPVAELLKPLPPVSKCCKPPLGGTESGGAGLQGLAFVEVSGTESGGAGLQGLAFVEVSGTESGGAGIESRGYAGQDGTESGGTGIESRAYVGDGGTESGGAGQERTTLSLLGACGGCDHTPHMATVKASGFVDNFAGHPHGFYSTFNGTWGVPMTSCSGLIGIPRFDLGGTLYFIRVRLQVLVGGVPSVVAEFHDQFSGDVVTYSKPLDGGNCCGPWTLDLDGPDSSSGPATVYVETDCSPPPPQVGTGGTLSGTASVESRAYVEAGGGTESGGAGIESRAYVGAGGTESGGTGHEGRGYSGQGGTESGGVGHEGRGYSGKGGTESAGDGIREETLMSMTVLTSGTGATYTVPAGIRRLRVRVQGGGGGGGGASVTSGQSAFGGGGGSGGYAEKVITTSPGSTFTYTIGAGGSAGSSSPGTGGTGGDTTWDSGGSPVVGGGALGGNGMAGGTTLAAAGEGAAGAATGGTLNIPGQRGAQGVRFSASAGYSGEGANSQLGTGGTFTATGPHDAAGYGSGGSGASCFSTPAHVGGAGGQGVIIVEEYQ